MVNVAEEVGALEHLNLFEMRALWSERFGPTPRFQSVELFRLMLAWRIQAAVYGGLNLETRKALGRSGHVISKGNELAAGSTIRRQWRGEDVVIHVVEDGFVWNGKTFRSLSAAATAVTGSRWMRWCVSDEAALADMLLGCPAGGDLGSMAARGVDECDWSRLCAGVVVDLFGVVAVGRDPSGGSQAIALRA